MTEFCKTCGQEQYEHGQAIPCPHFEVINNIQEEPINNGKLCNGATWWDDAMEGVVCSKCNLYTGSK